MDLRITAQAQVARTIADIQRQTSTRAKLTEQISSGLRLNRPSDGPSDFARVLAGKAEDLRLDAYIGNIQEANQNLNEGVSSLTETNKALVRASTIAQEGINGSTDQGGYEALAQELDGIIDGVVQLGNTQVNGRYIFAGTATQQQPFTVTSTDGNGNPATIGYQGSDERVRTTVGIDQTVETMYSGNRIFQKSGANVFQTLISLRDTLRDTSIGQNQKAQLLTQRLSELETVRESVLDSVGEQSATLANLEAVQSRITDLQFNTKARVGEIEGTDFASSIVNLASADNAFQAVLATSAKMFSQNILDFIR
jgi:flagellar hook-associated protein 3 FlgL